MLFRPDHQIAHGLRRVARRHRHDQREVRDHRERDEALGRVVAKIWIDRRRDRHHAAGAHQQRVAVSRLVGDIFGRGSATRGRPVLDHDRLPQQLRQFLPDQAGEDIVAAAGRKTDDHADRPARVARRRVGLCRGRKGRGREHEPEQGREREGARQRAATEAFPRHAGLPFSCWTHYFKSLVAEAAWQSHFSRPRAVSRERRRPPPSASIEFAATPEFTGPHRSSPKSAPDRNGFIRRRPDPPHETVRRIYLVIRVASRSCSPPRCGSGSPITGCARYSSST